MIRNETIQEITSKIDIIDIIGDFVQLKKRGGSNYSGLCPFHHEKSPSFSVSKTKEIYKCFGCGKSGNAITFIMEHEKLSYIEAMKWFANRYHIEIVEENVSPEIILQKQTTESLFILNQFAQQFYSEKLFEHSSNFNLGLEYIKERGFQEDILKEFQIGFASEEKSLVQELLRNQFQKEIILKSGLAIERNEQLYDNYRERIIFPIHNLAGKIAGFGARILKQNATNSLPKYINTPETEIYHKSKILYGIYFARTTILKTDECILVEGYTDVLALHQANIKNAVASGGTSLTIEQIQLIKKFTKNILIIYDGDAAGIKAASRGVQLCLSEGMTVNLVLIPDNEDPDSYIKKNGAESFKQLLKTNKKDFILFELSTKLEESQNDINKINLLVNEIAETIAQIDRAEDFVKQQYYIKQCSQILKIDEKKLMQLVNNCIKNKIGKQHTKIKKEEANLLLENHEKENPVSQSVLNSFNLLSEEEISEQHLARVLLEYGLKKFKQENETVADHLLHICNNGEAIDQPDYQQLIIKFAELYFAKTNPDSKTFIYFSEPSISITAAKCLHYSQPTPFEEWDMKDPFNKEIEKPSSFVKNMPEYKSEKEKAKEFFYLDDVNSVENYFLLNKHKKTRKEIIKRLENADLQNEDTQILIEVLNNLNNTILELGKHIGVHV